MTVLPPWHTWGASEPVGVNIALANNFGQPKQLTRVDYRRPESWRVWFYARPHNQSLTNNQLTPLILGVRFQLAFGVGRTVFDSSISSDRVTFAQQFVWQVPATSTAVIRQKWTNKIQLPELDDRNPSPTPVLGETEVFVADKIQGSAEVFCDAGFAEIPLNSRCLIDCGIFFAPNVHVRPEWFVGEFKGEEDGDGGIG